MVILNLALSLGLAFLTSAQTSFSSKAQEFANEVYQDCPQYAAPNLMTDLKNMLARVEVITETQSPQENYQLLSTVSLKNKCNTSMTRDEINFNPEKFNPLKYFFNFYPDTELKYRVDGTNYIVIIYPQH